MFKRTTERAVYIESLAQIPARFAELQSPTGTNPDPTGYKVATDFMNKGLALAYMMLAGVHRDPYAMPPTDYDVSEWEARALRVMREMAQGR